MFGRLEEGFVAWVCGSEWFLHKIEFLSFRGGYLKLVFWFHYVSVVGGLWVCNR